MRWKLLNESPFALTAAVLVLVLGAGPLRAQETGSVSGTVRAASTQQPLVAAAVEVVGTSLVAVTDSDGRYTLDAVPAGEHTLRVSVIGYSRSETTVTVAAGEAATAEFELQTSAITLDELVVTGVAGAQSKRELGNSVGKVTVGGRLEDAPISHATKDRKSVV